MIKRNYLFKIGTLLLLLVMLSTSLAPVNYAEAIFADVSETHWISKILQEMLRAELITGTEKFNLGTGVTESELADIIKKIEPDKIYKTTYDTTNKLTRIQAVKFIFNALELDKLTTQLKDLSSPFVDVQAEKAIMNLAVDFGWVSMNSTKTFKPDLLIKKEEAYAILYKVYSSYQNDLELLHSYYAISSFSQIDFTDDMDSLSFGWSRLEFNKDKTGVILNMTSTNANEYRVPTGYSSAITATNREELSRQLMVFVKDESIINEATHTTSTLTETLLADEKLADAVIASIMTALTNNAYKIPFDGVVIDFEGLKGTVNAANLNAFLSKLDAKIEANNLNLMVAVHPQRKTGQEYYNGYDYKTIGNYADYVILMAHDYYPKKLTPTNMETAYTVTPLAPINEIYYALDAISNPDSGVVDRSKVLLQLSMDSVQWKLKDGVIINSIPYHPTYSAIASRIESGVLSKYSTSLQSPYITFEDSTDGSNSIVWYEDERSVQAKLNLAKFFKIGGVSVWRLGTIPEIEGEKSTELQIWTQILQNIK